MSEKQAETEEMPEFVKRPSGAASGERPNTLANALQPQL
jgi:hypothetical protein